MNIHFITHANFEPIGYFETWSQENGHQISLTRSHLGETLPDDEQFDFLIVMGGPQSPLQLDKYPYLRDEIQLIEQAIKHNKLVMGICLGAQLIAESLGAKTLKSPEKEIGVFPIELTEEGQSDRLFDEMPKQFNVMHWHNDMPGIPSGAKLLAKSAGCPHQAFSYGDRVYGVQFHMEFTHSMIAKMVEHCQQDLQASRYTQSPEQLLENDYENINNYLSNLLNKMM